MWTESYDEKKGMCRGRVQAALSIKKKIETFRDLFLSLVSNVEPRRKRGLVIYETRR
jgi:hypothetical protein